LDIHDIPAFIRHVLERADWRTDLHFQTCTTIDTLDYSGSGLNEGSKLVVAAAGPPRHRLGTEVPPVGTWPDGFHSPRICLPGVLTVQGPVAKLHDATTRERDIRRFIDCVGPELDANSLPLIVIVDDSEFAARTQNNFLWVAFTRSNPAADIYGVD